MAAKTKKPVFDVQSALENLSAQVPVTTKASSKPVPKSIELNNEDNDLIVELAAVDTLAKSITVRLDSLKEQAKNVLFLAFTKEFWEGKAKPKNPKITILQEDGKTVDHEALFQLQNSFSLKPFQDKTSPHDAMITALTVGDEEDPSWLDEQKAVDLVKTEIVAEPRIRLKYSLTDLLEGHFEDNHYVEATDEEKVMGKKLLQFLTARPDKDGNVTIPALTEDERIHLLVNEAVVKFKNPAGFMERVCNYVDNVHQLRRVLTTFAPKYFFSHLVFAKNDNPKEKVNRLVQIVRDILGTK